MEFYNINNIKNINIKYTDIYLTPEYGAACEYSDNAIWELCHYKDLFYVYLKQETIYEEKTYYDLITPYGYSGYYYENEETYKEFIPLFRKNAKERNYVTEVLRQNPYLNINISDYNIITSKTIYCINLSNLKANDYLKSTNKTNRRMINTSIKNNLEFKILEYNDENINSFKEIYDITMNNLNSKKYFFFNESYYNNLNNCFIACIYFDKILCASCIIFKYNSLLYYHIGGSLLEYRKYGINNFLHYNVMKYGINNGHCLYVLGCGLKENDSLGQFKKKLSNKDFKYSIYKNILNQELYDKLSKNKNTDFFPPYRK